MSSEAIVTIPPEVVRTLASSTVLVKASSLVNLDFAGMVVVYGPRRVEQDAIQRTEPRGSGWELKLSIIHKLEREIKSNEQHHRLNVIKLTRCSGTTSRQKNGRWFTKWG
jgi:hypothetical protein